MYVHCWHALLDRFLNWCAPIFHLIFHRTTHTHYYPFFARRNTFNFVINLQIHVVVNTHIGHFHWRFYQVAPVTHYAYVSNKRRTAKQRQYFSFRFSFISQDKRRVYTHTHHTPHMYFTNSSCTVYTCGVRVVCTWWLFVTAVCVWARKIDAAHIRCNRICVQCGYFLLLMCVHYM